MPTTDIQTKQQPKNRTMQKFDLTAQITITTFTTIEAETLGEAIEKAEQRSDMMPIYRDGLHKPDDVWIIDELDGTPYNITVVE